MTIKKIKGVLIHDAEYSMKPFYYYLSNGIGKLDKVDTTLTFHIPFFGSFYYKLENGEEIMKGIENRKRFTIKYKDLSHEVVEMIIKNE